MPVAQDYFYASCSRLILCQLLKVIFSCQLFRVIFYAGYSRLFIMPVAQGHLLCQLLKVIFILTV